MDHTTFYVPGSPRGKERPRKGKNANFYTPSRTREYENLVAWGARIAHHGDPFEGPVKLVLAISSCKSRADTSNILKSIEDGMNGIVYFDDKQIMEIHITRTRENGEGVEVAVSKLRGEADAEGKRTGKRASKGQKDPD